MNTRNRLSNRWYRWVVLPVVLSLLLPMVSITPAFAQQLLPPLAEGQIVVVGLELRPGPEHQVVPKNQATSVRATLGLPGAEQGELPPLPADAVVIGQLRGPAFQTPVALAAVPGGNFQIPPLPLPGIYTLENIRLMSGGAVIVEGNPSTVRLEVIDKVLVSQVTSRPLTADEIKQKGIAVDPDNYQVVNFTVAFGLQDEVVEIEMPMIFPANNSAGVPGLPLYPIPSVGATAPPQEGILPSLAQTLKVPDVSISGFSLSIDDPERKLPKLVTPLPGVVIIPGNIAYLNQFFSVILKVSNVAPGYSNLEVRDLKATIVLPKGEDNVLDSLDDPLRMAKVGDPPVTQPKLQPVVYAGPDGKLKTEDDINTLAPQQSGDAEYLVEGRRQGIHTVEMEITGTLYGLPDGPVPVKGRAVGVVEVRDPQFALTINHPATVSAGEEYDLLVTVANISTTPANFVSLNLLPRSISGAELLSSSSVQIETIGAGDAETVTFRLRALKTGTVIANSIAADGVSGKFELRTAVGELGIPLSPTSLVLPPAAKGLPDSLRLAGVALLNQAFALASSPTTPEGLLPMGRSVIYDDAASLAATGQRIHMGEPLAAAARDLALDFLGNNYARLDQRFQGARLATVQSDYRGFDQLMRRSRRGTAFRDVIGSLWSVPIQANGALAFQQDFAEAVASRPAHLSVMVGADTGGAQAILNLADPAGRRLGITQPGGEVVQDIAFGGYFTPVRETDGRAVHYALVSTPASGAWTAEVVGTGSGAVDIGLVIPGTGGLQRVTFEDVALVAGSRARVLFTVGATNPEIRLIVDRDGDGFVDETLSPTVNEAVVDRAPSVISAVQIWTGNKDATKYGQVIGVLFSEEVDAASAQSEAEKETITKYAVDENLVGGVRIQADNRVVLLALRAGVGPYVDRTLTVSNVVDLRGNVMAPLIQSVPIQPKIIGARLSGTVRRADGTPVPFAKIALSQLEQDINDEKYWELVSAKNTDAQGRYSFDYVRQVPLKIQALDLVTNEQNYAGTSARFEGQHVLLDIILLGNGSVTGRVYGPDGTTPLAGAYVKMRSLTLYDDSGTPLNAVTQTGADGSYFIGGVPVGAFQLEAVHQQTRVKTQIASNMPVAGTVLTQTLVLLPVDRPLETGSVVGQVFRADGVTPAVGVPIYSSYGGYTETNASGAYRFDTVPVGDVSLRAIDAVNLEQADVRTTVVASSTVTANLILFGGSGTVRGAVFEDNGTPAAGISIYGGPAVVTTDSSGQFVLENIPVGTRQLTALDPVRNRTVQKGVHIANDGDEAIVQFVMPARGIISGRVFEAGGTVPAPNVKVIIYGSGVYKTFTNDKGEYTVENMPLGEYKVAAFLSDFSDGNIALGKLVYNNQVQRIDVVFKGRGKAVTGIVYDDDGKTPLGAQVGLGELKVKFGLLAPPENPGCLGTIDLGNGQSLQLPPCETVPVDFEFIQRARRVNSDPSTGLFTFTTPFVGPILVEAANAFSPQIVSVKSEVPAPNATVPVTLSLLSTGAITGTVFYPDGTPVGPNVIVQFNSGLIGDVAVRTDEGGNFSFPLVNPSVFELIASDPVSGLTGRSSGTVATGQTAYIPIKLLREGSVAITVIGADALPIAGADVVLREGHYPARVREGRTDNNGQITFAGGDSVSEGLFSVTAYDRTRGVYGSGSGTVPGVATSVDGHVAMTVTVPNAAATVVGRFQRINGTGIPNARVLMTGASGQLFTTTEADGYFQFDGVLKGNFQLSAEDPTTGRRGAASGVVSTNNVTVTVNMVEQALGTVTGVVKRMPEDQPLAGLQVTLFSSAAGRNRMTTTGTDGSYSFPGVPSGQFTLVAEDPYDSSIRVSASGVLTTEGQIATVNMTYTRPLVGRVEGQIFNADGSPAGAVSVYASPSGIRATSTITGYYSMHNVPLGKVDLVARPALGQRAGVGSGTLGFDGDVEVIDITLIGQGTLYGQVVDGGNNPVGLAEVSVQRRSDGLPVSYTANTQADTRGRFTVTNVLVGDISVTARQASTNLAGVVTGTLATDGGVLDLQVQLEPFGVVTGTVVRENGAAAPLMGLELSRTGVTYYGSSREDGSFTFENVKLGTYTLYIFDPLGKGIAKTTVTVSAQGQIVDLGTLTLDTAPPAVATITPANGAINVPVNQPIIVTFTEPVKASTINATNLIVTSAGKTVTGTWSLDAAAKVATFVPGVPFRDFTTYSLRIKKDILDLVDRPMEQEFVSSFTIADETPPTVTSRSPISGAFNVQLNTPIRIAFSEAIDPNAIVGLPVQVFQNGQPMSGTTSFILDNTVLVFVPDPNWSANAVVRVDLAAMPDIYGNKLPAHSYTFDTLDLIAPVIQAMTAPSGTTVLAGDVVKVVAEVDQTNDTAYVEFFVNGQSRLVDDIAPYEFNLPVPANASSDLTVAARASDRVGNVSEQSALTITVQSDTKPQVAISQPLSGTVVSTGSRITVTVGAYDDRGLARIYYQVTGAASANGQVTVTPAVTSRTVDFAVDVPVNAVPGSRIELKASAVDTRGQSSDIATAYLVVGDSTAPTVFFTAPAPNTQVTPGEDVAVTVSATDNGPLGSIRLQASGVASFDETRVITTTQTLVSTTFQVPVAASARPTETLVLVAQATDTAGNPARPVTLTLPVRDTIAPSVQVVVDNAAREVLPGQTISFTVAATDETAVARLGYQIDGAFVVTGTRTITPAKADASTIFTATVPATVTAGSVFTVTGTAADSSNNSAASAPVQVAVVDDTVPLATITSIEPDLTVESGSMLTVTVDAADDQGLAEIRLRTGGALNSLQSITTGPVLTTTAVFTVAVPVNTPVGQSLVITAEAVDSRGQLGASTPATVTVTDKTAPAVLISSPSWWVQVVPGQNLTVRTYATDNTAVARVHLTVTGAVSLTATQVVSPLAQSVYNDFTFTVPDEATASDRITLTVQSEDAAGNLSELVSQGHSIKDIRQPVVTTSVSTTEAVPGRSVEVTVTAEDEMKVTWLGLSVSGAMTTTYNNFVSPASSPVSRTFNLWIPVALKAGDQIVLTGSAKDPSGNVGQAAPVTLTVVAPGGAVSGTVTRLATGAAMAGVDVIVDAYYQVFTATTDANGFYLVDGLVDGYIDVTAVDPVTGLRGRAATYIDETNPTPVLDLAITERPVVTVTEPISGVNVTENTELPITVDAFDDLEVDLIEVRVNDEVIFDINVGGEGGVGLPYTFPYYRVPTGSPSLTIVARAYDFDGNEGNSEPVVVNVTADAQTTVVGRVIDESGQPVEGATVDVSGQITVTDAAGRFVLPDIPTIWGDVTAIVRITVNGLPLQGSSAPTTPVPGGTTDLGDIVVKLSKVWDGGAGTTNWHDAANWNDDIAPNANDDVYIPITATVTINADVNVNSLRSDGTLTLASGLNLFYPSVFNGDLTLASGALLYSSTDITTTGIVTWSGGTLSGPGRTTVLNRMVIDTNAHHMDSHTLVNRGVVSWTGGALRLYYGAAIENMAGATFELRSPDTIYHYNGLGAAPRIRNDGTLVKQVANITYFDVALDNSGVLTVAEGTLRLSREIVHTGAIDIQAGANLELYSQVSSTFEAGSTVSGAGNLYVTPNFASSINVRGAVTVSGLVRVEGNGFNVEDGALFTVDRLWLNGGTLAGSGTITVSDVLTWTSGTMAGPGRTVATNQVVMDTNTRYLYERTLETRGHTIWAGTIRGYRGGVWHNLPGAVIEARNDASYVYYNSDGARPVLFNEGLLTKSEGANVALTSATITNTGTLNVITGTLQFAAGSYHAGALQVDAGAVLDLSTGTHE
ncbi:MAG: carboxypeptidase regulatory-like domain-containing protein, partial [Caldilineaceae bacterium]|nr:carboxypeptidase regulatory-like domain-containing protein [Caldilineaceae bacterium]